MSVVRRGAARLAIALVCATTTNAFSGPPTTLTRPRSAVRMAMERTYIMIKPDGVQRGLVGEIIKRFEQRGYKLGALKLYQANEDLLRKHYGDLQDKPFFPGLLKYSAHWWSPKLPCESPLQSLMDSAASDHFVNLNLSAVTSGPVTCMVWEGENVVRMGRQMLGETNPQASAPGTIRGDFSIVVGRNICHGSDSVASAEKEIELWFDDDEVLAWKDHSHAWVYE